MPADTLSEWVEGLSQLHQRARRGDLSPDEQAQYARTREELSRAVLLAQQIGPHPGARQRRALRVAQALPVEIQTPGGRVLTVTLDLGGGGFSTVVSEAPPIGTGIGFRLKLRRGYEPLSGAGRVVNAVPQNGSTRMGVAFVDLALADRERLEFVIMDAVLKQFGH